jgi:hypothetical protein
MPQVSGASADVNLHLDGSSTDFDIEIHLP